MSAGTAWSRAQSESSRLWWRVGLPGLLASTVLAAGAVAVGWLAPASPMSADPLLTAVRDSPSGSVLGKVLVVMGASGMLRVWFTAAPLARGLTVEQSRRLGALALVWALPLLLAPVLFSRDVYSYITLSRLAPSGINPYEEGTGALFTAWLDGADPMWHHSPSPYGPLWTTVSSHVFHLTGANAVGALAAFRITALVGVVLMVVFLPRLAELAGGEPGRATWLAVLNPLVLFHVSASAHNDALMVGLLVVGLVMALTHRAVAAVVLVSVAGAIKAPALVVLPFVGVAWAGRNAPLSARMTTWAGVAGLSAATLAGLTLLSGQGFGWVTNLSAPAKVETWLSPATVLGRTVGFVAEALTPASADDVLTATRVVGVLLSFGLVGYLSLTSGARSVARGAAVAMVALVLLGPVMQPWYVLWALPLVAALPLTRAELRAAVATTVGFSIYSVATTSATTDSIATVPDGVVVVASVLAMGVVVMARRRTGRFWGGLEAAALDHDRQASPLHPASVSRDDTSLSRART